MQSMSLGEYHLILLIMKPRKKIKSTPQPSDHSFVVYPSIIAYGALRLFCVNHAPSVASADWADPNEFAKRMDNEPEPVREVIDGLMSYFQVMHEIDCEHVPIGQEYPEITLFDDFTAEDFGKFELMNFLTGALHTFAEKYTPELHKEMIANWEKEPKNSDLNNPMPQPKNWDLFPPKLGAAMIMLDQALHKFEAWKKSG